MKLWRKPLDSNQITRIIGEPHIIPERCKGCAFCVEFCPRNVFTVSEKYNLKGYHPPEVTDPEACTSCGLCELVCPEFAIFVTRREVKPNGTSS